MRLNPRQRWHEDDDHGLGWPERGSTTCGVTVADWIELHQLVFEEIVRRPVDPENKEAVAYRMGVSEFAGAIVRGIAMLLVASTRGEPDDWIETGDLRMRRGRGNEITIVSKHYDDMRSFLTNASLGWFERTAGKGPGFKDRTRHIIEILERSCDRRDNTWDYRDRSIAELRSRYDHRFTLGRRREAILSDIRFRKTMDEIIGARSARISLPERTAARGA